MKIKYSIRLVFVLIAFVIILSFLELLNLYYSLLIILILLLTISLLKFYNSILKLETEIKLLKNSTNSSDRVSDLGKNYNLYFENNPNPIWVYDINTLKFLDVNEAAVKHYGYSKKEFTSMKVTDISIKEELAKLHKNLAHPNSTYEISNSWHQIKKDGTIINVELFSHSIPAQNRSKSRIVLVNDVTEKHNHETEQKESENIFRNLIQNAAVGIFYADTKGNIQLANSFAADILGYTSKELLKMNIIDTYAENNVDKVLDQMRSLKPGSNIHFEPFMHRKDGDVVEVGVSLSVLENGSSVAFVREISNRKKKFKVLHESEELFRKLAENSASAIFIFQEDGFRYVNPAAIRLTGYTKNEFMKMKFWDIIHPDYREKEKVKDRFTVQIDNALLEIKILTKDGKIKWFEYKGTNIEFDGKPAVLGNAFDITDQKEAESLLKESESRFSAFMDSIPVGVFIADESSRFIYVNKQFQKIYNPDGIDLIGKNIYDSSFIPREIADKIINDDKKALSEGPLTFIETIPDSKGIPHVYSTTKFPIRGINEKLLLGCYHIDITDKVEAEEELLKNKLEYQTFFEDDLTGDYVSTPNGQLKTCNPAFLKIFGFKSIDEAKETNLFKLYPDPKIRKDLIKQLTLKQRLDEIEIVAQKIDGSKLYLIENVIGHFNDSGELIEIRGFIIDNTQRKIAEIELKKLSRAVEQSSASIVITDIKGNIQYVNPKFESVTGYTFNEVNGNNPKILKSGEKTSEDYRKLWETITKGNEWRGEFHNKKKNGELFWELASISPIMNDQGEIENFLAVKEDITERKKSENSLIESEKKFRTLFESANEGTILLRDMMFVDCNEKALHLYKATKKQLINKTPIDFSPEYQPDGVKSEIKARQKIKAALDGTPQVFEWLHSKTDGTLFFAEVNLIKIEIDGINYIHAFVRDITEYKKATETLKISEQKFKDIFNWAPVGIYQSLPDGKIITANSSLMHTLGYDEIDDLLNCKMQDIYYNLEDRQKLVDKYNRPGAGAGNDIELLWKKKDNSPVWVSLTAYAVRDKMGNTIYFEGFVYDITERKRAEKALIEAKTNAEEMNKLKSIFLTNMSHELRTPLIGILGYSEMLTNDVPFEEQREMAKTIFKSGKRLHETLNLILELSKVESEINSVQLKPVNIYKLLKESGKTFHSEVVQKGLRIQILSGEQDIYAKADQEILRKVIYNLITNAIKYTSVGVISLSFIIEKDKAVIKVEDTGIGIPIKDQDKIFEPFRQASEGFDRRFEGTGLGLTIAKKYMEMMNGKIFVDSVPGKGSTFALELPLSKNNSEYTPKQPSKVERDYTSALNSGDNSRIKKVLIVEDDNINIKVLAAFLKNDFKVDTANNAKAAIQKSSENIYDCILMDIALGNDMNGSKAAKEIKMNEAYKNIPIVAMTAYAMEGDREKFLSEGCTHYIAKPFNKDGLISLLKNITNSERNLNSVNQLKNNLGAY